MNPPKIITSYWAKPIPTRAFDWCAVTDNYDGPGSPIGHGATEQAAIDDLMQWLEAYEMNALTSINKMVTARKSRKDMPSYRGRSSAQIRLILRARGQTVPA